MSGEVMTTSEAREYLRLGSARATRIQLADRWGIEPVGRNLGGEKLWPADEVRARHEGRPGRGYRSDLVAKAAGRRRDMAVELAAPLPTTADLDAWLRTNHGRILAVAEALADHRETLLAATPGAQRDNLAEAIDKAGEYISARPSRTLAGAVAYALFLLRPDGPVSLPTDADITAIIIASYSLRDEYQRLRPQEGGPR